MRMMKFTRIFFSVFLLFALAGCFELIEDTTIHKDGSGEYNITLNLSASQTRLNSIMALDSIDGKKVPSSAEMKKEVLEFINRMNQNDGISNAQGSLSTEEWILKFSCSFDSLPALKNALLQSSRKWNKDKKSESDFDHMKIEFVNNVYRRQISANLDSKFKNEVQEDEDYGKLSEGKCVFIQRFDQNIKSVSSSKMRIAKNLKASMLMISPIEIMNDPTILDYQVILVP
jgi:hypothetical protein